VIAAGFFKNEKAFVSAFLAAGFFKNEKAFVSAFSGYCHALAFFTTFPCKIKIIFVPLQRKNNKPDTSI